MWVRADTSVINHPKMYHLADLLGVRRATAFGLLAGVWGYAAEHHRDGDLTHTRIRALHERLEWSSQGMASADSPRHALGPVYADVREVLIESRWADRLADGRIVLHDWHEHQGAFLERAHKERERKRLERESASADKPRTRPRQKKEPSADSPRLRNVTVRSTPLPPDHQDARASAERVPRVTDLSKRLRESGVEP